MSPWFVVLFWIIGLLTTVTVMFGVAAPFIWTWVFHIPVPDPVAQISSMLEVLVAIVALGIAVGAGAVYALVDRSVREKADRAMQELRQQFDDMAKIAAEGLDKELKTRLDKMGQDLNASLSTGVQGAQSELDTRLGEAVLKAQGQLQKQVVRNSVRLHISASFALWALYDQLVSSAASGASTPDLDSLLDNAIQLCRVAYDLNWPGLDEKEREDEYLRCGLLNNWGYFLARRGRLSDRSWAIECARFLDARKASYLTDTANWQETIDFIQSKYP